MTARTPEQDEARPPAENGPADSRQVRRRLTFGVAGGLAGLPASLTPWQRAYEAWRSAGLDWRHGPPPAAPADTVVSAQAAEPVASAGPVESESAPVQAERAAPAARPRPVPVDEKVYSAAEAKQAAKRAAKAARRARRPAKPARTRGLRSGIAVTAGLVLVAGGVIVVLGRDAGEPAPPRPAAAVTADALFAADPAAASDGLVQDLAAIAADGATIVAAGTEGTGVEGGERAAFLRSADSGRAWRTARVRAANGTEPPLGDRPRLLSGGGGAWLALGRGTAGAVVWTSNDAGTWTRQPPDPAFRPADEVNALTRTAQGFVAVGGAAGKALVWSSADGRAWQRAEISGITGLDRVAASGTALVTHGTFSKKVTQKKRRRKVTRTVSGDGLWRSADGGRTWKAVTVPQAQGSYGATKGLAAVPGGFATVREGRRTTGRKKHRKTTRFGVVFTSADGQGWRAAGRFGGPGFTGVERLGGGAAGMAVLVRGKERAVLRSMDGRVWQPGGTVAGPPEVSGLAVAAGAVAVSGHEGGDAYLSGVDLASVPGAVHPERTIRSVAAAPGRVVAVGSTNGTTAVWSSPDGRRWARAGFPGSGGWLSEVAYGARGWLAVGRTSGASPGPLAMTSPDGASWTKAPFPSGPAPAAATAGPSGYVAVGTGAAWHSTDLAAWKRSDIDGNPMDVAATATGYVAVGGREKAPAAWTSPDGLKWTPVNLPAPPAAGPAAPASGSAAPGGAPATGPPSGPLTEVAAHGNTVIALGQGAMPLVSADGGATWTPRALGAGAAATAVAATTTGFAAAGTAGGDAAVWTSPDGVSWRRVPAAGLGGPGDQRLTALTPVGGDLLGIGTSADHRGEAALLWRAVAP
ncbi:hypothetical protein AGRA3207_006065 [Actinomadura graeca]|uniref:Exo-alpha-sialidase n=1 Tax=Actinomadura graeca TaxID=2750812 RepID=A0ABX8R0U9_9ACTN|nr:hypothetical protein [Actinomadura graeca]QXJ24689.1 hypothetical protein AGRA3207_006065 [Actinomadura graeca]